MRRLLGGKARAKVGEVTPTKSPADGKRKDALPPISGAASSSSRDRGSTSRDRGSTSSMVDDASANEVAFESAMNLVKDRLPNMKAQEESRDVEEAEDVGKAFVYGTRHNATMEERKEASLDLARYVNAAFGVAAAALGRYLRETRGLAYVLQLLYEGDIQLQRTGLMVLANLASDAFDPKSGVTKKQVLHANVFERIKDFVYSQDGVAQTYACACLQNLAKEVGFAKLIRAYELIEELERLVASAHAARLEAPRLSPFTGGAGPAPPFRVVPLPAPAAHHLTCDTSPAAPRSLSK